MFDLKDARQSLAILARSAWRNRDSDMRSFAYGRLSGAMFVLLTQPIDLATIQRVSRIERRLHNLEGV